MKKKEKKPALCPLIMAVFKSQKGEMDADKRIVSLTKRLIRTIANVYLHSCVHLRPHSFRWILFQGNIEAAAHAYQKATDYLVEGEMRGLFGGPTKLQS